MSATAHTPKPLATYREVRFDGKRSFELNEDSIRIVGTMTLRSSFDTTIPLCRIVPILNRLYLRNNTFWGGVWMMIVGFIGDAILVSGFKLDPFSLASGLMGCLVLPGALLCIATWRKIEFARFESDVGLPILDIARAGPDRANFEDFVNKVLEQIRRKRETVKACD